MKSILVATLWLTLLGCFTPSAHSETGGGGNSPPENPLCFIRQNNSAVGGEFPCLRVSKMVTSLHLPATSTYDGPVPPVPPLVPPTPGPVPDPDTYRVQISAHPSGQPYTIELVVKRQGAADRTFTFNTVEDGSTGNYRTTQHFRLVSNPADDDFGGDQTIMVQLADTIKVIQKSGGAEIGFYELNVNRPHTEDGPDAIRTVDLAFHRFEGVGDNYPETAKMFLNRNWAQCGIRFNIFSVNDHGPYATNALIIDSFAATGAGSISLKVGQNETVVTIQVAEGETGLAIARKLADAVTAATGLPAAAHMHKATYFNLAYLEPTPALVLVNKGNSVAFKEITVTEDIGVACDPVKKYVPGSKVDELKANIVGLNFKDNDETTVDMFVYKGDFLWDAGVLAMCGGDFVKDNLPGLMNACHYPQVVVKLPPDMINSRHYSNLLGHELAHCLLNSGVHTPELETWKIFHPLVDPGSPPLDGFAVTNRKRFEEEQQVRARTLEFGLLKKK